VHALRTIYRYWLALVFLAVVAQVAAAAFGAFHAVKKLDDAVGTDDEAKMISEKTFENGFGFHIGFGYIIFLASVVLLLLALGARVGRPRIWEVLAVPLLVVLQIAIFAWGGEEQPILGAFHGVNALVIFALTGWLTWQEWRGPRREPAVAADGGAPATSG
jgi:hypothetical protein